MGICLSCLKNQDDYDQTNYNENTPLLRDSENSYDKEAILRKREEELNKIVDDTNEQLIDIQTFFNTNSSLPDLMVPKPLNNQLQDASKNTILQTKVLKLSNDNSSIETLLSKEEIDEFKKQNERVLNLVKNETTIHKKGPLVVEF